MALFEQDGLTQTALQRAIGIEQPTVVRTLDRMARDGLIERKASPTDRRAFQIYLTDKGRACEPIVKACRFTCLTHMTKSVNIAACFMERDV